MNKIKYYILLPFLLLSVIGLTAELTSSPSVFEQPAYEKQAYEKAKRELQKQKAVTESGIPNTQANIDSVVNIPTYITPSPHYDETYKYNYRTGYSGDYEYNYDIEGYGNDGYVYGTIDTSGKYGEGYIYDEYGNEIYVEAEWTDYGVLEGYDENGNWYEFEVY